MNSNSIFSTQLNFPLTNAPCIRIFEFDPVQIQRLAAQNVVLKFGGGVVAFRFVTQIKLFGLIEVHNVVRFHKIINNTPYNVANGFVI